MRKRDGRRETGDGRRGRFFLSLVSCPLSLFLSPVSCPLSPVLAVEVQPTRLESTILPDQPTHGTLEITNRASRPVQVRISTGPYRYSQPDVRLPSAQTWFTFEPATLTVAPKVVSRVAYSIAPPDNIRYDTAGEYLAAILIDEFPVHKTEAGGEGLEAETTARITVVPRFAMPVYLKVHGRERIQLDIRQLFIHSDRFQPTTLRVETTLQNQGTVHIRPTGTLAILDANGGLAFTTPIGKGVPLLPTATVKIPSWVPLPAPGHYKAVVTVEPQTDFFAQAQDRPLVQKEVAFEITSGGTLNGRNVIDKP